MAMAFEERDETYWDGDCRCIGRVVLPDAQAKWPAVLLAHAGAGFGEAVLERARMIAALGYVGFALDFYGERQSASGLEHAQQMLAPFLSDQARLRSRTKAAFDAMLALPEVDPERVAAIGYCFGGKAVLELARSGAPLCATVSFHGLLGTDDPSQANAIRGAVLACTGADDPLVPPEQLAAFQAEMRATSVDWQLQVYGGAKHAFTNKAIKADEFFAYDEAADRRSWNAMRLLLADTIG